MTKFAIELQKAYNICGITKCFLYFGVINGVLLHAVFYLLNEHGTQLQRIISTAFV